VGEKGRLRIIINATKPLAMGPDGGDWAFGLAQAWRPGDIRWDIPYEGGQPCQPLSPTPYQPWSRSMRPYLSVLIFFLTVTAVAQFIPSVMTRTTRAQEVGNVQRGLTLAEQVCAQCHLVVKGAGVSPNADAPSFQAIASTPGITSTALAVALRTSHRTMPNLVVERDQADDIIAYILSLKEPK